ncbi:MAG: hypothetical protein ACLPSH_03745 [Vulcanimicrobiaceae bacterium]
MSRRPTLDDHDEIDLGRLALASHHGTALDIRKTLTETSTDPVISAFCMLILPNRPHLRPDPETKHRLGAAALDQFCETQSTCAADYEALLDGIVDEFTYEFAGNGKESPIGRRS